MSIWKFSEINKNAKILTKISMNEGNTPINEFSFQNKKFIIKRDDKNPTGSWKDRGTAYKISELKSLGITKAVLASSGNAAISFLEYSKLYPELELNIVCSSKVTQEKLKKISELIGTKHKLYVDDNARNTSSKISAETGAYNLRSSIDNEILKGYWSLGIEIAREFKKEIDHKVYSPEDIGIFVPASSGTALVGLAQGIQMELDDELLPRIFPCQTDETHPFLDQEIHAKERSLADAIIDKVALRKPQIDNIITKTNGEVLAITNAELLKANDLIHEKLKDRLSFTSLLSVAGAMRKMSELKLIVCVASGR